MRAKRIAAQVKARGYAELWSVTDADGVVRQWISTGAAAYPVDGMPYLKVENLPALLSLSEKELEKLRIENGEKPEYIDLRDVAAGECIVDMSDVTLSIGSQELLPAQGGEKTYFVDMAPLAPIMAEYKKAELWMRKTAEGIKYFAVKNGLLLVGIVMPMEKQNGVAAWMLKLGSSYEGDERGNEAPYGEEEDEPDEEIEGQEAIP